MFHLGDIPLARTKDAIEEITNGKLLGAVPR